MKRVTNVSLTAYAVRSAKPNCVCRTQLKNKPVVVETTS